MLPKGPTRRRIKITRLITLMFQTLMSRRGRRVYTLLLMISALSMGQPIRIRLSPSSATLNTGESVQFSAVVQRSDAGVRWTLSHPIGSVSATGLYTAPPSVTSSVSVTVTATSVADSRRSESALVTISPAPRVVSISPVSSNIYAGTSQQFSFSVGTAGGAVWSISPAVGTISTTGLFTAPASVTTATTVYVTATSLTDSTAKATATLEVKPVVSVSISPNRVTVRANGTQSFSATVTGTSNTGVNWSLSTPVGSISTTGVYTAPAVINLAQSITVIATSLVDPNASSRATIALEPPAEVSIKVTPGTISLAALQTQLFLAAVTGLSDPSVTWSLSPQVGTISSGGLYTAPPSIASPQTVYVAATSTQDPSKSGLAQVQLLPASVLMPIEVIGAEGTTREVGVTVPDSANLTSGIVRLDLQVHNLAYENKLAVQVNAGQWIPVNYQTASLQGLSNAYGGFGGGFSTHRLRMALPLGSVVVGANTIRFKYNKADGFSQGVRILKMNIIDGSGNALLGAAQFQQEDPSTWRAPFTDSASLAEGKRLYQEQPLVGRLPNVSGVVPIKARCASCHTKDGRDLKYFSMSNASIRSSAMSHGMSATQGDLIASYIRSLPYASPGRIWNPPYQPGPGLDAKSPEFWSAGAGIDAVLDRDADSLNYIAPGGNTSQLTATANLSAREIPVALQLPDWFHWLPKFHPADSWGDAFTISELNLYSDKIRAVLVPNDPTAYQRSLEAFRLWIPRFYEFIRPRNSPEYQPPWSPDYSTAIYSTAQWVMVQQWSLNQDFGLEGMARAAFGPQADSRAWYSQMAFETSTNALRIPLDSRGIGNGLPATQAYFAYIWYHTQLILNNGNKVQTGNSPIDWGYMHGFVTTLRTYSNSPQAGVSLTLLSKGLQVQENGRGPELGIDGWMPHPPDVTHLLTPQANAVWAAADPAVRRLVTDAFVRQWFQRVKAFAPSQWYKGGWARIDEVPRRNSYGGTFGDRVWYIIPQLRYLGVDPSLSYQIADWAQTVWPAANWSDAKYATCTWRDYYWACSSDQ